MTRTVLAASQLNILYCQCANGKFFGLQNLCTWHIIYLTREPIARVHLATRHDMYYLNSATLSRWERYFLCLSLVTRVITAHSIMINVNNSVHVIIGTNPLPAGWLVYRPIGCPVKYIILSMWLP